MDRETHKSEQKTSMAFATAFAKITVIQTLVKTVFFQRVFGMRAGRPRCSRRRCHKMKVGMRATATISRAIFTG
jgi:hypothetical protein